MAGMPEAQSSTQDRVDKEASLQDQVEGREPESIPPTAPACDNNMYPAHTLSLRDARMRVSAAPQHR